jgi:hypothetical protein
MIFDSITDENSSRHFHHLFSGVICERRVHKNLLFPVRVIVASTTIMRMKEPERVNLNRNRETKKCMKDDTLANAEFGT